VKKTPMHGKRERVYEKGPNELHHHYCITVIV
jgi:hypothetical protein